MYGRYATDVTIALLGGTPLKGSAVWVEESDVDDTGIVKYGVIPKKANF